MNSLPWPPEAARYLDNKVRNFIAPGSNWVLDFHGDPRLARLVVFSDGNHHMALEATMRAFLAANPDVEDIFYTTTPPAPLIDAFKGNGLAVGNLRISCKPDVFIGPDSILEGLQEERLVSWHAPFAESRGTVLLVRKGNPKKITSVADLLADDVILGCSNPVTEKASFAVYTEAIGILAQAAGIDEDKIVNKLSVAGAKTVHSQIIHHREIPELIGTGRADVAIIYYHLALRYTRIFPDMFEFIDIGGMLDGQRMVPTTRYHLGLITDAGPWGEPFIAFMQGSKAQQLYRQHGLTGLCPA